MKPFIPKEHPDLPDSYRMLVVFKGGQQQNVEAVTHCFTQDTIEIRTVDDRILLYWKDQIRGIEFDSNFSKIVDIKKAAEDKDAV